MNNDLIEKLSEDMAYAILSNEEIRSPYQGVLKFSSCVDMKVEVTSSDPMRITCENGVFSIDVKGRPFFAVLKEAFSKIYYTPLLSE